MAIIICDIDDTLLRNGTQPIRSTIEWINSHQSYTIALVTGRPRSTRAKTISALRSAGIKYNSLYMNPYSTQDSDKWKYEKALSLNSRGNVVLAIENDESARAAYRRAGVPKVVAPGSLSDSTLKKDIFKGAFIVEKGYN